MNILSLDKIEKFIRKHANARSSLLSWLAIAQEAKWEKFQDIRNQFNSAKNLESGRVVFKISGNNFRLVVVVKFKKGDVLIERIGTHAEYDRWKLK